MVKIFVSFHFCSLTMKPIQLVQFSEIKIKRFSDRKKCKISNMPAPVCAKSCRCNGGKMDNACETKVFQL